MSVARPREGKGGDRKAIPTQPLKVINGYDDNDDDDDNVANANDGREGKGGYWRAIPSSHSILVPSFPPTGYPARIYLVHCPTQVICIYLDI